MNPNRSLLTVLASVVSITTPLSAQWTPVTGLPAGFNPSDVAIAPDGSVFTCGTASNPAQSGIYRSTGGGSSWTRRNAGLADNGADLTPWRIGAFSEVTLAATNGGDGIYRSLNAGDSWTTSGLGPAAAYWDFCRFNADTYFVTKRENVVGSSGVWRSLDRGLNWTRTSAGLYGLTLPVVGDVITAEAVTLHNGKLFCGVSTTGVFRSTNAGDSWANLSGNVYVENTVVGPLTSCTDLATTGSRLFASIQNYSQVFMTQDDGDSWRQVTTGLGNFAHRMAADGGVLYVPQTNGKLYFTTDGASWQYYPETGLPGGVQPFLAVKHGVAAYFTTASGLYKLDLSTATAVNIPPVITLQPAGGTRLAGQSFTFTVNANGTGPFAYQWLKNGAEIPGATSASYTRGPLVPGDADNYSCRVTGPGGAVTSNAVSLAVFAETPGTVDPTFDSGMPIANTTSAVNCVAFASNGRLWTAGSYTTRLNDAASGSTAAGRLTTYTGNPLRFSTDGAIPNGSVIVLLPLADGKVLAGGTFTAAGGNPGTATKFLARYNSDGTFDGTFVAPPTTTGTAVTAMVQDPVTQKIYVAGTFTDYGGDAARDYVIRLHSDGTLDGSFSSASMIANAQPAALALAPDGRLYVGGSFFGVNIGGNTNFSYVNIVRLNTDGTVDTTFPVTNTLVQRVVALSTLPDGRLYVATNNGNNPQQLQRLLPNATVDPSFALAGNATNIATIALQPDGKVLVGGNFTTFAGTATPGKVVRLLHTGAVDTSITYAQPGTDSGRNVTSLALSGNRLYVAQFRGGPRGVHRYFNDLVEPSFYAPPQSQNINAGQPATLRAYVYSTQGVTYQWYKDGALMPGATTDTLTFNSLTTGDTGSYTVVVTHPFGAVTSPPAVLRALAAPQVGTPPASVTQPGNRPLTLAPDVFGQAPLTYQWLRNGTPLANNAPTGGGGVVTGVNTAVLNISGLAESDNGVYTLRVTNSLGTLDVPVSVTALPQAGYLPLDFVGPGGLFSLVRDAGNDRFFAVGTGGLSTWNGTATTSQLLRIKSDNTVDTTFTAPAFTIASPPPNNAIWASDVQLLANGQILVWGGFVNVAGQARPSLARLNSNGTLDPAFIANSGIAPSGGGAAITRVLELRDGRLLVAGNFTNWGAGPAFAGYTRLVCLDPNGSLNADFMNALGEAPNQDITDMELLPDGRPVLSGGFTRIGGANRTNMAVLELNGSVSTSFNPPLFSGGTPDDIMALPDGRVLAGGIFTSVTGSPQLEGWVVLNANGTRDATVDTSGVNSIPYPVFGRDASGGILVAGVQGSGLRRFTGNFVPDQGFLPVENSISGFNGINHIIGLPSGRIVIRKGGNSYQNVNATGLAILRGYPVPVGFITQPLGQTVSLGSSFTLSVTPTGTSPVSLQWLKDGVEMPGETGATLTISSAARSDSAVYSVRAGNVTGGTVTSAGARVIVLAEPVFTAISSSRTVRAGDTVSFSATAIGVAPLQYQWLRNGVNIPGANSSILTLAAVALDSAATYTCAASNIVNNVAGYTLSPPVHLSVAGGNGGALDPGFSLHTLTGSPSPKIETLEMAPNGELTFGGSIWNSGSYYYAARHKPDGTRAAAFLTNSGSDVPSCNGFIYKIARDPQTGNCVAVGNFSILGGASRSRIGRFKPDFLADATFNPGTGFTENFAFSGANGAALAIDSSSRVYVGGGFATFNGTPVPGVIRLLANGTLDSTFTAPAFNNGVNTLLLHGDKLLVGGGFNQVNGAASPPLVRLNSDGTRDAGFTSALSGGSVYDLAAGPDGDFFAAASGSAAGNNYVHRFNADGSRETTFNTGTTINQIVRAVAPQADGKVFIGGQFSQVNGQPRGRVAKLNADGTLDTAWVTPGNGINGGGNFVYDLALGPNGTLYIGGDFTQYDTASRQFIAAVYGTTAPRQIVSLPAPPAAVQGQPLSLGVAATGVAFASAPYLTYQWLKNNQELPGQTGQTLTIASYTAADEGTYTVRVTDAGGATVSNPVDVETAGAGFSSWADALPAGLRGPADDPDFDGIPNLIEYALDLDPLASSAGQMPPVVNNGTHLTYTYRRVRSDITYSVEAGDNLALPWSAANVDQGTPAGDGTTTASLPLSAAEDFLRLRVTLAP